MRRKRCDLSSVEVVLVTLVLLLFLACLGLIVVSWLALDSKAEEDGGSEFTGRFVILHGATFSEDLLNKSSGAFKALAYDTEQQINGAYRRSSLQEQFQSGKVSEFSQGSVVVSFDVVFRGAVRADVVREQLVAGLQQGQTDGDGLKIDSSSVEIFEKVTTTQISSTKRPVTAVTCPDGQKACADGSSCVHQAHFCDGVQDCPDDSDETQCATVCDGQFLLLGSTGSFHSKNFPHDYDSDTTCRWIIRVAKGFAIKMFFHSFHTEEDIDVLMLYEGTGSFKTLTYSLSGSQPGNIWLSSHEATVEFYADFVNNFQGFNASYRAENISHLHNEDKVKCSFEDDFCFWRQELEDNGDWLRAQGSTLPPDTGPSFDHTLGNQSGYYIVTPRAHGGLEKKYRLYSLTLSPANQLMCLSFWYHMFGEEVWRLMVLAEKRSEVTVLFQKEGNYGDNWNYGQITLNITEDVMLVFEARKKMGVLNDIALDDINMSAGPCEEGPPDPTHVPLPTTPPPIPSDCGGPFDLYDTNSTFSSPNYPNSYGNKASCIWTLHAEKGQNIQLHFQDVALEAFYDVLEVRDGVDPHSQLLGVLTGIQLVPDFFSTASMMTIMLYTDALGTNRGFLGNFSTGYSLGRPDPCPPEQFQCGAGNCVSQSSVCNGIQNCSDGSDEAHCVHLVKQNISGSDRLGLQLHSNIYSVCAEDWSSHLTDFFCRYLGSRSGIFSSVTALPGDAPFTTVALNSNGTLDLRPSDECVSGKIVTLQCNNQPCGVRKVVSSGEADWQNATGKVVGGQDAEKGAWPWVVSLHWLGQHICGASLIDSQWLITAAHCVYGKHVHLSNWAANLGLHSLFGSDNSERQVHMVDEVIINKHYNRRTKESDFALMHLQTPVNFTDFIQPVCLPDHGAQLVAGRRCFIAGWGQVSETDTVANILQQADLPLLNNTQCQEWLPEYNITERMVCAGYAEGGVDSCQGDSGGPLMCEEDGHWVLVGVTSFGKGCGRPRKPGVYALVSQFVDWVLETRRLRSHWKGF